MRCGELELQRRHYNYSRRSRPAQTPEKVERDMIVKSFLAGLMLLLAGSNAMAAVAGCTSTSSLSGLGPPGAAVFGETFMSAGSYMDCYEFTLTSAATSVGGVIEVDPRINTLNIDITDISLFAGGVEIADADSNPYMFTFSGLLGGGSAPTYTLAVASTVNKVAGLIFTPVSYAGAIVTGGVKTLPEPGSMALLAATLLGLVFVRRVRQD